MMLLKRIAIGLFVILTIFSCSKDKSKIIVAKVGDRVITLDEFEHSYSTVNPKYLPDKGGFEGEREFLNTMINKDIMAIKADQMGYDKDAYVVNSMKTYERMGLLGAYLNFQVAAKVKVTDQDLKDYYRRQGMSLDVKQILVNTRDEGEKVYKLLQEGNDFDTVCKRYSLSPDADVGGKVLTMSYGGYSPEFQDAIFDMPVGGISKPLQSTYGYFIVKVLKKRKAQTKPFDKERPRIEKAVTTYKQMEAANKASEQLRKKAGVKWYDDALKIAFDALPADRPITNPPARDTEVKPILHFAKEDLDMPIVTYKDKVITLKDFSDMYDNSSFFSRPRREYYWAGVRRFLVERIMNEIIGDEVKSTGITDMPEVKKAIKNKREELMVSKMYEDIIRKQVEVNPKEISDYYHTNLKQYKVPEKQRYGVILTGDRASALEAYDKIKNGENFESVVLAYSTDENTKKTKGRTELIAKGEQPELDEVGFSIAKIGDVTEPFQTSRGWIILKLLERQRERTMPLSEAVRYVESALVTMKSNERLNQKLEEWKKEIGVVVYENNLRKARVEDRIGGAGQGK